MQMCKNLQKCAYVRLCNIKAHILSHISTFTSLLRIRLSQLSHRFRLKSERTYNLTCFHKRHLHCHIPRYHVARSQTDFRYIFKPDPIPVLNVPFTEEDRICVCVTVCHSVWVDDLGMSFFHCAWCFWCWQHAVIQNDNTDTERRHALTER